MLLRGLRVTRGEIKIWMVDHDIDYESIKERKRVIVYIPMQNGHAWAVLWR
jgi:hypothetical protein